MQYPWHCPWSVVCHVSSVSTIITRNNEAIKSIFSANVYHVPGLCLLGIVTPYIGHKIMAQNHIFTFFTSSLKDNDGLKHFVTVTFHL